MKALRLVDTVDSLTVPAHDKKQITHCNNTLLARVTSREPQISSDAASFNLILGSVSVHVCKMD